MFFRYVQYFRDGRNESLRLSRVWKDSTKSLSELLSIRLPDAAVRQLGLNQYNR